MSFNSNEQLRRFLKEDIGKGDITTKLFPNKTIQAEIICKENGILAGINYIKYLFKSQNCSVVAKKKDGEKISKGKTILTIKGNALPILSTERTALNLLSRMSGIATKTNNLVTKTKKVNSNVKVLSTRKTAPGLRFFDKEAVKIGGGEKHRSKLDDMVMIKDNHLKMVGSLELAIKTAKEKYRNFEIEVENQKDAITAAKLGTKIIMLDNFSPSEIKKTVNSLKKIGLRKRVKLEASGGITSKNIGLFAASGIDYISSGELTHSVKGIDFSLEITG